MPSRKLRSADCENEAQSEARRIQNREAQRRHREKLRQPKAATCNPMDGMKRAKTQTPAAKAQRQPYQQPRNDLFDVDQLFQCTDMTETGTITSDVTSFTGFPISQPVNTISLPLHNVPEPIISSEDTEMFIQQLADLTGEAPFLDRDPTCFQDSPMQSYSRNQAAAQTGAWSLQQLQSRYMSQSPISATPSGFSYMGGMPVSEASQSNSGRQTRQSSLTDLDDKIAQLFCSGKSATDTPTHCALHNETQWLSSADNAVKHLSCSCGPSRAERLKPESMARRLRELYESGVDLGCLPPDEAALRVLLTLEERFRGLSPAQSR